MVADWPAHAPRVAGLRRAFAVDGLTIDDGVVFTAASDDAAGGFAAAKSALAADPSLTAIFATHDTLALGALEAVTRSGRRVPDDVSLIGFDDVPEAGYFHPALTTVRQEFAEVGRESLRLLLDQLSSGSRSTESVLVEPALVRRDTVAARRTT